MGEEKKINAEVAAKSNEKSSGKLSYEELQGYAQNMAQQAEAMGKEIQRLRIALQSRESLYQELHFAFKVVENSDKFSSEFVSTIISKIEETMTPVKEEEKKNNPENKE